MNKHKYILLIFIFFLVIVMSVGYATFATELNIDGKTTIIGEWNVKISDIKVIKVCEECDAGSPSFTDTTATFEASLVKPGDEIVYELTIENAGLIDAKLANVIFFAKENNEIIDYKTTPLATELLKGESTKLQITIKYRDDVTENTPVKEYPFMGVIEYTQK